MDETARPSPKCRRCDALLTPGATEGLCPRCLIALTLTAPTEIPGETGPHGTKVLKPPPAPDDIARHFPQLEILACLGRGGMGVVYQARQPKLNRIVALKILAPEKVAETKFAERFQREAQALARFNHPNIVTVYDFGEADGLYYLIMEFVDGVSLRHLLRTRQIAPEEALAIVPKICEALQFAHEQGVVHRDIKPENVLLDKQGRVKIADFGIAKIVAAAGRAGSPLPAEATQLKGGVSPADAGRPAAHLTQDQVLGTPHYMAPEQMTKPELVDHRADIYSLGVVFYEMLTGELPLGKFQPPSKKVQVDVRLDEVVLHALEKEPERRYQHVSQVKNDVETIAGTSQLPKAAPARHHTATWKVPIPAVAAVIIVLAIVVGVLVLTKTSQSPSDLFSRWRPESNADDSAGESHTTVAATVTFDQGRSYPPDTDYHDAVQRVFLLEAARMLAWHANQADDHIAEIAYQLGGWTNQSAAVAVINKSAAPTNQPPQSVDRPVVWLIRWLDAEGKTNKTARVEYSEALLKQGPEFYRQTFQQLWAAGWEMPPMNNPSALEETFWRGAGQAGWSREESLRTAYELLESGAGQKNQDWIPQMAGLLVHSALPGVAGNLSLDRVLLARGAAWLALAEQACSNQVTRLWSPVMFLAEREQAAAAAWRTNPAPKQIANQMTQAWDLWLRRPTSQDAYLFAVDADCPPIALAMLAYDVQANGSGHLFAEMFKPLAGSERRLTSWHNYGPLLARWGCIDGGRILEGKWPVHQRRAWLDLLKQYHPAPQEKLDFSKELQIAAEAPYKEHTFDPELDACLTGFTNFAPLLRLGYAEGTGKLVPTAVATGRDLLNYGWESTGLQLGERYHFVRCRLNVPDLGETILQTATREVPGLVPFFQNADAANVYNYQDSLHRLQNVDGFWLRVGWSPNPFSGEGRPGESTEIFLRRCWLRSSEFAWQAHGLWNQAKFGHITDLSEAITSEAGPLAASRAIHYLVPSGRDNRKPFWIVAKVTRPLAEMVSQPTHSWVRAVWHRKFFKLSPLAKAQELEKTYWRNTESKVEDQIILEYCKAGAFEAARRFYLQARENFLDAHCVSRNAGLSAFVLGYCLNDEKLRQMALEDSASGTYADMRMRVWDATIRDDLEALKEIIDEVIDRYEPKTGEESVGRRLRNFLPLLDALADPKAPRHKEAIDYFGDSHDWYFARWIWVEKFTLPEEEAIAFLGGRETDATAHALVCGLQGDPAGAEEAIDNLILKGKIQPPLAILASYVCREVAKAPLDTDTPDLKPPGATSTYAAVRARLEAKRR